MSEGLQKYDRQLTGIACRLQQLHAAASRDKVLNPGEREFLASMVRDSIVSVAVAIKYVRDYKDHEVYYSHRPDGASVSVPQS